MEIILPSTKIVYIDMDNTICNMTEGIHIYWEKVYDEVCPLAKLEDQTAHWIPCKDNVELKKLDALFHTKGLFESLPALPGAIEGVKNIMKRHKVFFASRPDFSSPYCVFEKALWLLENLGKEAYDRAIFLIDKSVLAGHYLIDDAPHIEGELKGKHSFEHIIYAQNYNTHMVATRRITWENWQEILPDLT